MRLFVSVCVRVRLMRFSTDEDFFHLLHVCACLRACVSLGNRSSREAAAPAASKTNQKTSATLKSSPFRSYLNAGSVVVSPVAPNQI